MVAPSRSEYFTQKNITKELIRCVSRSCREHLFPEIKFPKFAHPSRPLKRVSNQEDIRSVTVRKSQLHTYISYYYTSDSLWKTWLVESIQSIHNSLWTWHDKCNICCRYCIFIMSSSTSAWLLSPLECSPQKQNGRTLRFCFWGWIMWKMYNKTIIEFGFRIISWISINLP